MSIEWGEPIQHDGKQPDWVKPGEPLQYQTSDRTKWFDMKWGWGWGVIGGDFRLPSNHWAYAPIRAGFTPWAGGESAPDDWDGDEVLFRRGHTGVSNASWDWTTTGSHGDIIGYRKRAKIGDGTFVKNCKIMDYGVVFNDPSGAITAVSTAVIAFVHANHPDPLFEQCKGFVMRMAGKTSFGISLATPYEEANAIAKLLAPPVDPIEKRAREVHSIMWPDGEWEGRRAVYQEAFRRLARHEAASTGDRA